MVSSEGGPVATGAGALAAMAAEYASFTGFKKRVDDLIRDLKGSEAGPGEIGRAPLVRGQFGGGGGAWAEASGLFTAYASVISELKTLSKLLSDSMEGMGIAVVASHKGYQNVDRDVRRRMAAISAETTKHYGESYDPSRPRWGPGGDSGGTI
ncbi:hypothetical protein [Streptomyces sp. NPDC046985]|uniref:hypothetical protein n=1 Tax=Streptomyces sp. NPDC046985 TaxID=3155377 RepID=UPI0033C01441